jgi:hypothetical protein
MKIFYTAKEDGRVVPLDTIDGTTQHIVTLLHGAIADKVIVYFPTGHRYSDFNDGQIEDGFQEAYNTFERYVDSLR